jgi:hypothetical protein
VLVIAGRLVLGGDDCDEQLELPREPPFPPVLLPLPAAVLTVALRPDGANFRALAPMFAQWYAGESALLVACHDDRGRWLEGKMRCARAEIHEGIQSTRTVLPPHKWRVDAWGRRVPYRDQPVNQRITKPVHEYVLVAERYAWCPARAKRVPAAALVLPDAATVH